GARNARAEFRRRAAARLLRAARRAARRPRPPRQLAPPAQRAAARLRAGAVRGGQDGARLEVGAPRQSRRRDARAGPAARARRDDRGRAAEIALMGAPLEESRMAREKKERVSEPDPEPDAVRYGAAVAEIEQILASIDRDEIDIDELSQKVERAVELLKICRARLKATELRVTQVLQEVAAEKEEEDDEDEAEASDAGDAEAGSDPDESDSGADRLASDESKPPKSPRRARAKPDEDLPF